MNSQLSKLCSNLGYRFNDSQHLQLAVTHRSAHHQNNERLEFLGDAILNLIIAENLFQRFSKASEGELTRLRAALVSKTSLAKIAKKLKIGDFLLMGSGELKSGGFRRDSVLADALEAIIAAIYLDNGFEVVRENVLRWFADVLAELSLEEVAKDAKTQLQEWLQAQQISLPLYEVVKTVGQVHEQYFYVQCFIAQLNHSTQGEGVSRKAAEQHAAEKMLDELRAFPNKGKLND